ncbi:DEAD/DEAH box helicase [Brevibacterium sp. p3-SID960]|uniref:DEAD/DEAH box helicase n=1 Tax=Brevibacterium sp. p3-SID960 TaxID=2916063 RepID=UPI0021A3C695|nr:DEAD/DEAH box helicase [Brevibacterium sp. p3-SID960]MCT1690584.1 DEAD/DEAH box helicase [Brevibacterium sp. p3-SID960]
MTTTEQTFADLGVSAPIADALADKGIVHPFPIQAMTLPVALTGADIIGQAKTGTGKTLGFGIPLLERVVGPDEDDAPADRIPQALVVVPTRELAQQVAGDLEAASTRRNISVVTIYGGKDFEPQIKALESGAEVVVGTPGRLLDLVGRRILRLGGVRTAVLDEADEMLDLGFLPDVEKIISHLPAQRQTMLFSATMPGAVISMARRYMIQPTHIRSQDPDDTTQTAKNTTQYIYRAHAMDKTEMVARLLQAEGRGRTIIFARTKRTADRLAEELGDRGMNAKPMHGDLPQQMRERYLKAFRDGTVDVLVATDVAARGIDISNVTHVINYQCPDDEKTYVHRIGRTGRAGESGIAVTFVDWDDVPRWKLINRQLGLDFDEPVETYSTSPHFFADLNIPKGTKGRINGAKPAEEGHDRRRGGGRSGRDGSRSGDRSRQEGRTGERRQRRRTRGGRSGENTGDTGANTNTSKPEQSSGESAPRRRRRRRRSNAEQPAAQS